MYVLYDVEVELVGMLVARPEHHRTRRFHVFEERGYLAASVPAFASSTVG